MAKIIFGAFIADMKGKVGATVFQSNKGGAFARNRVVPSNPQTEAQTRVRGDLSTLSSQWRGLTDGQRNAWSAAAPNFPYQDRLGQTKTYSGQQLFMKLNTQLLAVNPSQTLLADPPTPVEMPSGVAIWDTLESDTGDLNALVGVTSAGYVQADHWLQIKTTDGLSTGIMRPSLSLFKQVQVSNPASLASPISAGVAMTTLFGSIAIGKKVFLEVNLIAKATGQSVLLGRASAVVVDAA